MNLNKAIILGRVAADPQLRTTPSGQSVTTIGVATNRAWLGSDGKKQQDVEFHQVVLWGKRAEVAVQYLVKGALVLIEGRIATRTWKDKDDQTRKTTEIIAERIQLGPKSLNPDLKGAAGKKEKPGKTSAEEINKNSSGEEEIPIINLEEEEIKTEDIPF